MSVSVVITNLTAAPLHINELYVTLGAAGSATASDTISRSVAQLDSMNETKTLLAAGSISLVATESSDNADLISIPLEQHGEVAAVSVAVATEVLSVVTFAKPFPVGIVPIVTVSVDKSAGLLSRSQVYAQSITNTGFTAALVVTTLQAASTVDIQWVATY